MADPAAEPGYETPEKLELIWGKGFMLPGGADEVARIASVTGVDAQRDRLRGQAKGIDALVDEFVAAASDDFHMVTLPQIAGHVAAAGFADVQTEDCGTWYLGEARDDLARLGGALGQRSPPSLAQRHRPTKSTSGRFWSALLMPAP